MKKLDAIFAHLAHRFLDQHPKVVARFTEQQELNAIVSFVTSLNSAQRVLLLEHLNTHLVLECFRSFSEQEQVDLLFEIPVQKAASLLRVMGPSQGSQCLQLLPQKIARTLSALVNFPENSAGALMNPQYLEVSGELSLQEVKKLLRKLPRVAFYQAYVVDEQGYLQGVVALSDLLRFELSTLIQSIQKPSGPKLSVGANTAEIISHPAWQDHFELPVIDEKEKILGVLSYPTLRALQEKYQKIGIHPIEALLKLSEASWMGMNATLQQASHWLQQSKTLSSQKKK